MSDSSIILDGTSLWWLWKIVEREMKTSPVTPHTTAGQASTSSTQNKEKKKTKPNKQQNNKWADDPREKVSTMHKLCASASQPNNTNRNTKPTENTLNLRVEKVMQQQIFLIPFSVIKSPLNCFRCYTIHLLWCSICFFYSFGIEDEQVSSFLLRENW